MSFHSRAPSNVIGQSNLVTAQTVSLLVWFLTEKGCFCPARKTFGTAAVDLTADFGRRKSTGLKSPGGCGSLSNHLDLPASCGAAIRVKPKVRLSDRVRTASSSDRIKTHLSRTTNVFGEAEEHVKVFV
jgi:hypothetical protein